MVMFYDKDSCCLIFDKSDGSIIGVELDGKEIRGLTKISTFSAVNEPTTLFMEVIAEGFSTKEKEIKFGNGKE